MIYLIGCGKEKKFTHYILPHTIPIATHDVLRSQNKTKHEVSRDASPTRRVFRCGVSDEVAVGFGGGTVGGALGWSS
jgi:hypothetical protein